MRTAVGCDIVYIPEFERRLQQTPLLVEKLFTHHEILSGYSYASLAGKFAVKEAVVKALGMSVGDWQSIEVIKDDSGKPFVKLLYPELQHSILSHDVSISHDGQYAIAVCVFVLDR